MWRSEILLKSLVYRSASLSIPYFSILDESQINDKTTQILIKNENGEQKTLILDKTKSMAEDSNIYKGTLNSDTVVAKGTNYPITNTPGSINNQVNIHHIMHKLAPRYIPEDFLFLSCIKETRTFFGEAEEYDTGYLVSKFVDDGTSVLVCKNLLEFINHVKMIATAMNAINDNMGGKDGYFIHGDLHVHNVLFCSDKCYIIDYEKSFLKVGDEKYQCYNEFKKDNGIDLLAFLSNIALDSLNVHATEVPGYHNQFVFENMPNFEKELVREFAYNLIRSYWEENIDSGKTRLQEWEEIRKSSMYHHAFQVVYEEHKKRISNVDPLNVMEICEEELENKRPSKKFKKM